MSARLDPKLLKKLSKRLGKTEQYLREQISKRSGHHRVSSEAYFVHWLTTEKIGSANFRRSLSPQIQGEILSLVSKPSNTLPTGTNRLSPKSRIKILQIDSLSILAKPPIMESGSIDDAKANSEIYPVLYLFENSLRTFIERIMSQRYGIKWWKTQVNIEVQDTVKDRMQKEKLNPWHGSRGVTEIFYSDFTDLIKILNKNGSDFAPFFRHLPGGLSWLTQKLKETAVTRNNIAHSAPLKKRDRERFVIYFHDWYAQLDQINPQM